MDIAQELQDNQTMLMIVPSGEYNQYIIEFVKQLSKKSVCYVTLNKTFESLVEVFRKNGVHTQNVVFIDAISKTMKQMPDQTENCFYCTSPAALTELSITIDTFLRHNFDYIVFDSLTNLLVYQKGAPVSKFVSSLVNKVKGSKTRAVFYALGMKEQESLIQEASMYVDNVIDIGKNQ